ncbi:hypothetical protein [uncultured Paraglaciecola sp.]|uniref:hypothetical protein n=1 Tax=uncultured Paraglaciecola sp. TaxID=1765024 RepID=UPI00261D26C7|nr:hypothetical protein [uncultured Paraglaciecola sp.]
MSTAQDLINSSAKQAGILAEGQSLEGGVNSDALKRLNRMIARFQNDGIDLGLSTLAASDEMYIDDADEEALEIQLTLRLMVRHRRPLEPALVGAGDSALKELQAKYTKINTMTLDSGIVDNRSKTFDVNAG